MGAFFAGLDLGQAGDFTALAIIERVERVITPAVAPRVERIERPPAVPAMVRRLGLPLPQGLPTVIEERVIAGEPGETVTEYHVRHLERPELGIPYPKMVERVLAVLDEPQLRGNVTLILDRTGVGRAVYDLFAQSRMRATVVPITITGGDMVSRDEDGTRGFHVPKRDLVGTLQVLLQAQRLRIADGLSLGKTLAAEMLNFKAKISVSGHDSYEAGPAGGAWREGAHDDLVLAVTLPCWYAESAPRPDFTFFDW